MGKAVPLVVFLSGHDHSLQLLTVDGVPIGGGKNTLYQVVSGSAGKKSPVRGDAKHPDLVFSNSEYGLVRFDVLGDEMWIEFIDAGQNQGRHLFRLTR